MTEELQLAGDTEVARWLTALADARIRTLRLVDGLTETLDEVVPSSPNTIGSVLYHIAAIEADYLFDEILGSFDDCPTGLFPVDVREQDGKLTAFTGESLEQHLERLRTIRELFVERVSGLTDFHTMRKHAHYDMSPAYVVHHLLQHEAEHRAEIGAVRRALGR